MAGYFLKCNVSDGKRATHELWMEVEMSSHLLYRQTERRQTEKALYVTRDTEMRAKGKMQH